MATREISAAERLLAAPSPRRAVRRRRSGERRIPLAVVAPRVEVALYDVVLTVDAWVAVLGLDHDHAVHAIGDVYAHWRGRAVMDVHALVGGLEGEPGLNGQGR